MLLVAALIDGALYLGMKYAAVHLSAVQGPEVEIADLRTLALEAEMWLELARQFYIPVTAGFFLLVTLLLWLCNRISIGRVIKKHGALEAPRAKAAAKTTPVKDEKKERTTRERLFLHLFSVLQREGRLMDFLSEDLDQYEDEQIGAAVRNIHENCTKVVDKYLKTEPILEKEEEEEIVVESDFDPNAVKLTGNVTGDPPFKGVVRHRGWRTRKLELPTLSGSQDPRIIAPAEVEIL
ncbi:MAG: DUF2760 domain-containing protein [Thermodesulfobacteriota bacterium]